MKPGMRASISTLIRTIYFITWQIYRQEIPDEYTENFRGADPVGLPDKQTITKQKKPPGPVLTGALFYS